MNGKIKMINIFKEFSTDTIAYITKHSIVKEYNPGQEIILNDDSGTDVYFMLKGNANALNYSKSGKSVNYAELKSGDFFGELSAVDGLQRSATVMASATCKVAVLAGRHFNFLIDNDLTFNRLLLSRLVKIIRSSNERIRGFMLLGANQRVCLELLRLALPSTSNASIIQRIPTQEVFAENSGTSRESVIRAFKKLTDQGVIKRLPNRTVYINDKYKLELMALSRT